ncbi:MAG: hypothetical protein WBB28_23315 [Crinalium sp.]
MVAKHDANNFNQNHTKPQISPPSQVSDEVFAGIVLVAGKG